MTTDARLIEVNGQRTRVLDRGRGHPVVVLHGWGGRLESMTPVIDCLSSDSRVIAIDLPGFGDSSIPGEVWGTPDYAKHVAGLLARLEVHRAHFVAHSFGAKVSFFLSATSPALVDKLVLVGSSGLRTPPSNRARLKRALSRVARHAGKLGGPGRSIRDRIYRSIASEDYRDAGEMRPIFVKVVNEDFEHLLPQVSSSTLLVWGTQDDATPPAHARRMEALIPDAGLVWFEGAGHFAYLDEPARFCHIVRHFLAGPADG